MRKSIISKTGIEIRKNKKNNRSGRGSEDRKPIQNLPHSSGEAPTATNGDRGIPNRMGRRNKKCTNSSSHNFTNLPKLALAESALPSAAPAAELSSSQYALLVPSFSTSRTNLT